ncbi:hypothetical protein [Kocuria sediminis]|nr:hypothetical protein [Kocuria sediminis]
MDSQLTVVVPIDPVARCRTGAALVPVARPAVGADPQGVAA